MKDFEVQVRIKNNHLKQRRDELDYSQEQMALSMGIDLSQYAKYERMQMSPLYKKEWKDSALKIADYFQVTPEEIFPDVVLKIENTVVTRKFDGEEIALLSSYAYKAILPPDEVLIHKKEIENMRAMIGTLTPREEKIICSHFGIGAHAKTLEQIGKEHNVSRERIRQIEQRALRKMRHPSRHRAFGLSESSLLN